MMESRPQSPRTKFVFAVVIAITAMTLFGNTGAAQGAVRIGIVLPLSGPMGTIGEEVAEAYRFAVDELRRRGDLGEDSLEFVFADTGGDPAQARATAERLIAEERVSALIGGISGSAAWEIASIAQRRQIPFLITTASADSLTRQGWDYVFRLSLPASEKLGAFAEFMDTATRGIRTGAVLHDNSQLGPYRSEALLGLWHDRDIETLLISGFPAFSRDFRPLLAKAKVKSPDLIYLIFSREDAPMVLRQAKELRLKAKMIIGEATGFGDPELFQENPDVADYFCVLAQWAPGAPYPGVYDFAEAYRELHGKMPDYRAAQAYAGMQVLTEAVRRARHPSPQNLRQALSRTTTATVFGRVKFEDNNGYTHQNHPTMLVLQWIDQEQKIVWPRRLASKRLVFPHPEWRQR